MATIPKTFTCEICHITVGSELNFKQHLNGKKHATVASKLSRKRHVAGDVLVTDAHAEAHMKVPCIDSNPEAQDFTAESFPAFPGISDFDSQAIQLMALHEVPENIRNAKCTKLCGDIDRCLRRSYPKGKCMPFGSIITGLACHDSDIDVYFNANFYTTNNVLHVEGLARDTEQKMVKHVRNILLKRFPIFQGVFAIPSAKVALVKFSHMPTQVNCDLSFKNGLSVFNSTLIKVYLSLDPRIKPVMMVLRHWGKVNGLTGSGNITHYALVWMMLYYLQQLQEPVVPTVASLQTTGGEERSVDGWKCSFRDDVALRWRTANGSTIQELLQGFFRLYAQFDHELLVICPLVGRALPKTAFCGAGNLPPEMNTLKEKLERGDSEGPKIASKFCVQDPFVLDHNITFTMSRKLIERFRSCCSAAEIVCTSALQLQALFEKCDAVDKTKKQNLYEIKIFHSKQFSDDLLMIEGSVDRSCEDLKNEWYGTVYKTLIDVFENVFKFEVCDSECSNEGTEVKVRKLDSQCDVSGSGCDFCQVRTLKCKVFFYLWDAHKTAYKDFNKLGVENPGSANNLQKESAVQKQKVLADFIIDNFSKYFGTEQPVEKSPVMSFTCQFDPKQNPVHVVLKFSCDTANLSFIHMMVFFKKNLLKWIEES